MTILEVIAMMTAFGLLLFGFLYLFFKIIYEPFKLNTTVNDLEDLMVALNTIIEVQMKIYEDDIFVVKGSITNSNFENYYKDITNRIISSLSPEFYKSIQRYYTDEAIVTFICRRVKIYLTEKIYV